jgi:hypothetical protein
MSVRSNLKSFLIISNSPDCAVCGEPMQLDRQERHQHYANLKIRHFSCQCGHATSDVLSIDRKIDETRL